MPLKKPQHRAQKKSTFQNMEALSASLTNIVGRAMFFPINHSQYSPYFCITRHNQKFTNTLNTHLTNKIIQHIPSSD